MAVPIDYRVNAQPAVILSTSPWRETSLLLDIFSQDFGRVSLIARGARKKYSLLSGLLMPFALLSLSWYGKDSLKTLHQAEWIGGWPQPSGAALLSCFYLNELIINLTAKDNPEPQIFHAFISVLKTIATTNEHIPLLREFEWLLLEKLGVAPDIRHDTQGNAIQTDKKYWLEPESSPILLIEKNKLPETYGMMTTGAVLIAMQSHCWHQPEHQAQILSLNRMLLDFRLPKKLHSRSILQDIRELKLHLRQS